MKLLGVMPVFHLPEDRASYRLNKSASKDRQEDSIEQLRERVRKALEPFSVDELRQLVEEIEEIARAKK